MKKVWKLLAIAGFVMAGVSGVEAQQAVVTSPIARSVLNASGTIGVTNTFQSLWTQNSVRVGCTVQNNDSNAMWVYFGPIANATKANSVLLDPGQVLNCSNSGVSATDQVSITGTSTGAFFASQDGGPTVSGPAAGGSGVSSNVNVTAVGGNAVTTSLPVSNVAGSAIIGQVGIDQTTPGTTNGVSAQGNVASGAADSGNPVKTGCVYNTTLPTVTTGNRVDCQSGSAGRIFVTTGASQAGADAVSNSLGFGMSTANDPNSTGRPLNIYPYDFNGTSWDRHRPGPYQLAQTPVTNSATGTTTATAATLPALASKFTYICGFTITADATAALAGAATVAGTVSGSLNYIQNVGTVTAAGNLSQTFSPCIPSSAVNTAIVVTSVAAGAGGSTAVSAWGFQGP